MWRGRRAGEGAPRITATRERGNDLRATGDGDFEESEDLDSELLVVADEVNELAESNEVAEEAGCLAEETGMVAVPDDAASPVSVVAPRRPPTLAVLLARGADF